MVVQISKQSRGEFEGDDCRDCCVSTYKDGAGKSQAQPLCCCGHATAASRTRCLAKTFGISLALQGCAWAYYASAVSGIVGGDPFLVFFTAWGPLVVCGVIEVLVLVACVAEPVCCPVVPAEPEPPLAPVALPN
jgi:hypothetical protein